MDELKNNIKRVIDIFVSSNHRFLVVFIFFIVAFILYLFFQNRRKRLKYIAFSFSLLYDDVFLLLLSSISIIALFFAPYTEIRTFLFVQIFIIVIVIRSNLLILRSLSPDKYRYIKYFPNIFLMLMSVLFLYRLTSWTLDYSQFDRDRSLSIKNQITEGKDTIVAKIYHTEKNRYLNTREGYIREIRNGGQPGLYNMFHGASKIRWSMLSYEEENNKRNIILLNIPIPQDVSNIITYDLYSIDFINDNLVLHCGVLDPQVNFSLQQPIARPSGDPYVEIECTNSESGTLQIFYDFGAGLSEENSVRQYIEEASAMTKIRLPIIGWSSGINLYSIRVDPPDGTVFEIKSIKFGEIDHLGQ